MVFSLQVSDDIAQKFYQLTLGKIPAPLDYYGGSEPVLYDGEIA